MKKFKGTGGKWVVLHHRKRQFEDTRSFRVPISSMYGKEVNFGYLNAHAYGRTEDQLFANAQLISHAPEMLEMLINIKDYLGSDKRAEVEKLIESATNLKYNNE